MNFFFSIFGLVFNLAVLLKKIAIFEKPKVFIILKVESCGASIHYSNPYLATYLL